MIGEELILLLSGLEVRFPLTRTSHLELAPPLTRLGQLDPMKLKCAQVIQMHNMWLKYENTCNMYTIYVYTMYVRRNTLQEKSLSYDLVQAQLII